MHSGHPCFKKEGCTITTATHWLFQVNARDNKLLGFAKAGIGLATSGNMSIDVTNKIESVCDEKIEEMTSYYKFTTPKMDAEATKSNLGEKAVAGSGEPMVLGNQLVDVLTKLIEQNTRIS